MWRLLWVGFLTSLLIFMLVGYYYSDNRHFKVIIREENLTSPRDVFAYVLKETQPIQPLHAKALPVIWGLTPRQLLEKRKYLWCNEGAILFLAIVRQMGYKTHLVNLLDENGVSRHTVAEVLENNKWVTYDYTNKIVAASYQECVPYFRPTPMVSTYPNLYNTITGSNFFLMKTALFLRSLPQ